MGCRQVVRQRTLTPLFRGFKSFHPNQIKTRCNASGFLFFKYRTGMLILVHVKLEYEKGKSCLLNICGHDFLFFNNQIDSVSLLELELVEKSNLNGSYFLRTRSLGWSMFKALAISFLSLVKVSEYFIKDTVFNETYGIKKQEKSVSANLHCGYAF